jgi:phage-related protein
MAGALDLTVVVTLQDKLSPGLSKITGSVSRLGAAMGRIAAPVAKLGAALTAVTGVGLTGALAASAGKMVDVNAQFETFETVLRTITGSAAEARQSMAWISDFAAKTPYELTETTSAFVKLKAYGMDPLDGTLRSLGDTASAMGKPLMQAVEALADAVTGENERLKEFGIKARAEGDQIVYTWTENNQKMTRAVDKNSPEKIRLALLEILNRRFQGSMEAQSRTFSGMMSNISDSFTRFWLRVGQAGSFDSLKNSLAQLLGWFDRQAANGKMQAWANDLSAAISRAAESLDELIFGERQIEDGLTKRSRSGGLLDRLPGIIDAAVAGIKEFAAQLARAYDFIRPVVDLMGGPFKAALIAIAAIQLGPLVLALATLATPLGLVVAGLAAIALGAKLIYDNWEPIKAWFAGLGESIASALQGAVQDLYAAGEALMQSLWDGIKAIWAAIKDWFSTLGAQFVAAVSDGFGALRAAGEAMIQSLWDGAMAKWEAFKSWLGSLGDKIGLPGFGQANAGEPAAAQPGAPPLPPVIGKADDGEADARYERSRRAQAALKQGTDMEAARGLAMRRVHGGPAQPQQVQVDATVDAKVEGEAAVKVDVQVEASPDFISRVIRQVEARMPLRQTGMATGVSTPDRGQSVLRP